MARQQDADDDSPQATTTDAHNSTSSHSESDEGKPMDEALVDDDDAELSTPWKEIRVFRDFCGKLVNNEPVQLVVVILIMINAILMGIATNDFVEDNPKVNAAFEATDMAFLITFTVEIGLQFIYHGHRLFSDAWLVFDFVIVVLSWSLEGLQIVRAFRIFRAVRLVARLTILKNLVLAIFAVAPSVGAICALLLLILYIFAVLCTQLFSDLYTEGHLDIDYFGTLDKSLFTLFEMMTLEWSDVARQVAAVYYWAWFVFIIFVILTGFILYSLLIAVVCDAVNVTENQERADREGQEETDTLEKVRDLRNRLNIMSKQQKEALEAIQVVLNNLGIEDEELSKIPAIEDEVSEESTFDT